MVLNQIIFTEWFVLQSQCTEKLFLPSNLLTFCHFPFCSCICPEGTQHSQNNYCNLQTNLHLLAVQRPKNHNVSRKPGRCLEVNVSLSRQNMPALLRVDFLSLLFITVGYSICSQLQIFQRSMQQVLTNSAKNAGSATWKVGKALSEVKMRGTWQRRVQNIKCKLLLWSQNT